MNMLYMEINIIDTVCCWEQTMSGCLMCFSMNFIFAVSLSQDLILSAWVFASQAPGCDYT
jgi:hypothetical protein